MGSEQDKEERMRDLALATTGTWTSPAARPPTQPVEIASRSRAAERFVGGSAAAQGVRETLSRIARSQASVLVQGASGTGKELAARIVHDLSPRAGGPFVAVDCGALAEGLLESELFGHSRGAFTGASFERHGLFEEAAGGTLFLDEIANTSLGLQARLLRVLQEREVRRLGANRSRAVDVRVVAASNRELVAEVAAGRFREDLLYRLDVLSVRLPSLAERQEDVPALVRHLLAGISARLEGWWVCTELALALLAAWSWPGNVRELHNVLERAATFAGDGVIDAEHLPERITGVRQGARGPASRRSLQQLLDDYERVVLRERLEANGWNRTRTARQFGITRRCLFDKVRRHGLAPRAGRDA